MENKKELILAAIVLVLLAAGIGGYILMQNNDSQTFVGQEVSQSNGQAGIIAMLGQSEQQTAVQGDSTTTPQPVEVPVPQTPPETEDQSEEEIQPYDLNLPSGWEKVDSEEVESCNGEQPALIETYEKGAETITVYENTYPSDCSLTEVADVYLDFDFSDNNAGLRIDTNSIEQCSKDDNPDCPKGDGKVSMFIGNEEEKDSDKFAVNEKTNNTYLFEITDTKIDGDFEDQVKALATLLEDAAF